MTATQKENANQLKQFQKEFNRLKTLRELLLSKKH